MASLTPIGKWFMASGCMLGTWWDFSCHRNLLPPCCPSIDLSRLEVIHLSLHMLLDEIFRFPSCRPDSRLQKSNPPYTKWRIPRMQALATLHFTYQQKVSAIIRQSLTSLASLWSPLVRSAVKSLSMEPVEIPVASVLGEETTYVVVTVSLILMYSIATFSTYYRGWLNTNPLEKQSFTVSALSNR